MRNEGDGQQSQHGARHGRLSSSEFAAKLTHLPAGAMHAGRTCLRQAPNVATTQGMTPDVREALSRSSASGLPPHHDSGQYRGVMHTVTSRDGTRIAFWRSGEGPPLVLVHGATADHTTTWRFALPELERHFTLYAMDRRGRGGSGDAPSYALEREAEDVASVVDSIGAPASVLGHSYGGLCAIEAALQTDHVSRLILYEAVPLRGTDAYPRGIISRFEELLEAGDVDGMLTAVFRELVQMPQNEIDLLRSQAVAWKVRLSNSRTLPREMRAEERYVFAPERFRRMRVATLLLVGGDSPQRELANADGVAAALPDATVVILPGQQHIAMYSAPGLFVKEVVGFLAE